MSCHESQQCAMVDKGGKCCEGMAGQGSYRCIAGLAFGILVIAGLITLIVLQSKVLKALHKGGKKK